MNIKDLVTSADKLAYKELGSAMIEKFGVRQPVNWDSVLPKAEQHSLFGGEILRLIEEHPTLAELKEIRPVCLMKGELSQLLFFYVQLKDEKLPKPVIERITRKFVGGTAADRYIIWFFGNKKADVLKVVISGREGKKIRLKTLPLEVGQWFKTYDYILDEVERKFNTGGLFQSNKEPSELYKAIWEAFDISIVNKKFYAEIKEVFDKLIRQELPKCKGVLTDEQERVQFAIRLIGRIIFCWFLKRKGIVKDDVMSSAAVRSNKNYYRDLLELLFFEVFNTPVKERRNDLPVSIKDYPFLNGGLFEPQKQDCKDNYALYIPNEWFEGFFGNTLEKYNFTIDENTAASAEIAIDPEMLGRIFENLLAEINPETGESARKSTGSFYTPREIVDFMVEESLIAYLKTGLNIGVDCHSRAGGNPEATTVKTTDGFPLKDCGNDDKLQDALEDFVRTAVLSDVLKPYSKELLSLLNAIKVLDPASGSGAFPISMLQKIVELKHVLDPQASLYDLKLKTLENSIYGVDIQPMATELSRLRCWLSLMVDEDPKDIKPLPNLDFKFVTANSLIDLGYDEFLEKVETGKLPAIFLHDFKNKLDALRSVRQKYFDPAMGQKEKDKLKKEFSSVKAELFDMSLDLIKKKVLDAEFANKINNWEPFDDSKAAPFFSKEWMFGVMEGFDIVMGNPPYGADIDSETIKQLVKSCAYYDRQKNSASFFIEIASRLVKKNAIVTYIVPKSLSFSEGWNKTRQLISSTNTLHIVIDASKAFENVLLEAIIISFINKQCANYSFNCGECWGNEVNITGSSTNDLIKELDTLPVYVSTERLLILRKISQASVLLSSISKTFRGLPLQSKISKSGDPILRGKNIGKYRIYREIDRISLSSDFLQSKKVKDIMQRKIVSQNIVAHVLNPYDRIIIMASLDMEGVLTLDTVMNTILTSDRYSYEYILALLNSQLAAWFYYWFVYNRAVRTMHFDKYYIDKLPIREIDMKAQQPFITLVNQILNAKKQHTPQSPLDRGEVAGEILSKKRGQGVCSNADTSALEKQIDELVYKLYDLTAEEILIVEGR